MHDQSRLHNVRQPHSDEQPVATRPDKTLLVVGSHQGSRGGRGRAEKVKREHSEAACPAAPWRVGACAGRQSIDSTPVVGRTAAKLSCSS